VHNRAAVRIDIMIMWNPSVATLLVAMALIGMLPFGAKAGSYRRPVIATGTVAYQPNQTVFNLSGTCVMTFPFSTSVRIRELELRVTACTILLLIQTAQEA